jgi:ribulose-5-phosphate 4-epimerase/fuculose-1-phosphate aldolase
MYYLERACRLQVLARSMGGKLRAVRPDVIQSAYKLMLADAPKYAAAHFEALKRILDREEPAYSG